MWLCLLLLFRSHRVIPRGAPNTNAGRSHVFATPVAAMATEGKRATGERGRKSMRPMLPPAPLLLPRAQTPAANAQGKTRMSEHVASAQGL